MQDQHAPSSPHLARIATGKAPGALFVRIVTDSGHLLREYPLWPRTADELARITASDIAVTDDWLTAWPDDCVRCYVYDGDSGECLHTIVIDEPPR